jgi:hypothetical protein
MLRIAFLLAACAVTCRPLLADSAATVTEAVNQVSYGSSQSAATDAARIGSKIQAGQFVETGVKSRAELELANLSITRLGANTIFDYSPGTNTIDLQEGTVLFSKPKDSTQMNIKTASVTAAVLGTTGFVQIKGKAFFFGIIEGSARVSINGVTYHVGPGEVLQAGAGGPPAVAAFNLPRFLATSPLLTSFHSTLPNQVYINEQVATYNELVSRGFIETTTHPTITTEMESGAPSVPATSIDQASRSHSQFNKPPPPPPRQSG